MNNETPDQQSQISKAFVSAWSEIRTLAHDADNPHFKNRYTSYDRIMQAIRPIFARHGLSIMQPPLIVDDTGHAGIHTIVMDESGATIDLGSIAVPCKKGNDPQAFGSAMTYAKRYALCAALCIPTGDDDDGNLAATEPPVITKAAVMAAINRWSGMTGEDATAAAKRVVELAGSTDPQTLMNYVDAHKGDDFVTHTEHKESAHA